MRGPGDFAPPEEDREESVWCCETCGVRRMDEPAFTYDDHDFCADCADDARATLAEYIGWEMMIRREWGCAIDGCYDCNADLESDPVARAAVERIRANMNRKDDRQ